MIDIVQNTNLTSYPQFAILNEADRKEPYKYKANCIANTPVMPYANLIKCPFMILQIF